MFCSFMNVLLFPTPYTLHPVTLLLPTLPPLPTLPVTPSPHYSVFLAAGGAGGATLVTSGVEEAATGSTG